MDDNKKITIDKLKPGDILLYEPDTSSKESMLISKLTKSPVTHAAMCYYETHTVIEENEPKIALIEMESRKGRPVNIMRFKDEEKDLTPVLNVAEKYLENEEPYSTSSLLFAGITFLFRDLTEMNFKLQIVLIPFLELIMAKAIQLTNNKFNPGTKPMVCSQFVYDCYKEAGEEYKLHITYPKLENTIFYKTIKDVYDSNLKDLDLDIKEIDTDKESSIIENVYDNMKKYLKDAKDDVFDRFDLHFKKLIYNIFNEVNKLAGFEPLDLSDHEFLCKLKERLIAIEEYFVSPGDLLMNCKDLNFKGKLDF